MWMFKYQGLILVIIPVILGITILIVLPDVVRNYPLVFGIALALGILVGILAVTLKGGMENQPADDH
jgi:hypothetical protein